MGACDEQYECEARPDWVYFGPTWNMESSWVQSCAVGCRQWTPVTSCGYDWHCFLRQHHYIVPNFFWGPSCCCVLALDCFLHHSGPSTTNIPVSNHQAIMTSLKERHELETEALLSALSEAKKDSKALCMVNCRLESP